MGHFFSMKQYNCAAAARRVSALMAAAPALGSRVDCASAAPCALKGNPSFFIRHKLAASQPAPYTIGGNRAAAVLHTGMTGVQHG